MLQNNIDKYKSITHIEQKLYEHFRLTPIIGAEIEFYIKDLTQNLPDYILKEERGNQQFEIDILPEQTLIKTLDKISHAQNILRMNQNVILSPKPFIDDYGNAMHIHINFLQNGILIFDTHSGLMEQIAQILCHFLAEHFTIFAPTEEDYKRFDSKFMAPTHICFGGNNRTVAIRIPDKNPLRLEHRVPSNNINIYDGVYAILSSIYYGLKNPENISLHSKIYGNAWHEQYDLNPFPKTLIEAQRRILL
jgi:glutamine synthetase